MASSQDTRGVVIWPAVGNNPMNALDVIGYQAVPGELNNCTLEFEKLAEKA
jgi:hypothetical protein